MNNAKETRKRLVKIKRRSALIVILGAILTALGISQFYEADKAIMILDQGRLDEMVLK